MACALCSCSLHKAKFQNIAGDFVVEKLRIIGNLEVEILRIAGSMEVETLRIAGNLEVEKLRSVELLCNFVA